MKTAKIFLNILLVLTILAVGGCRQNDQQGEKGSPAQQGGGSSAPTPGGGK